MKVIYKNTSSNVIYGMGFIGAVIYYISVATSFWSGAMGIIKAIFWPAVMVFEAFKAMLV